jgi:hypothetical protein
VAFETAARIDPDLRDAWERTAAIRYKDGVIDGETEGAARKAAAGAYDGSSAMQLLASVLAAREDWTEALAVVGRILRVFRAQDSNVAYVLDGISRLGVLDGMLPFFRQAARTGHAFDTVRLLDETGMTDRWRPLREALAAVAEGRDVLRRVAPEVRTVAERLLDELVGTPEGSSSAGPPAESASAAPKTVKRRARAASSRGASVALPRAPSRR